MGIWHNTSAQGHPEPVFPIAQGRFLPRVAPLPCSLTQGTTTPGTGRTAAPPRAASQTGKKTQCRSLFLRTKGLCALLLKLPPLPPSNLQEGGQRAIFQRPPVYLGNKPTPSRLEGSFGRPKSQLPLPQETAAPALRPSPPRRPRTRPRKGRGGERGAVAPVPRCPPTSRSRARRALQGFPLPSRRKAGPGPRVPRWRGGRGPESFRRQGRPEPWGSREGSASLPSPPGRLGPSAACASSGWRFDWAGPGPPPEAGRIRQGPRPRAGGGRVPAAGRAGRPAGGRRVAAAPGLK